MGVLTPLRPQRAMIGCHAVAMPGRGTARRSIRVEDELWRAALEVADERGEDLSALIRDYLRRYVRRHRKRS